MLFDLLLCYYVISKVKKVFFLSHKMIAYHNFKEMKFHARVGGYVQSTNIVTYSTIKCKNINVKIFSFQFFLLLYLSSQL